MIEPGTGQRPLYGGSRREHNRTLIRIDLVKGGIHRGRNAERRLIRHLYAKEVPESRIEAYRRSGAEVIVAGPSVVAPGISPSTTVTVSWLVAKLNVSVSSGVKSALTEAHWVSRATAPTDRTSLRRLDMFVTPLMFEIGSGCSFSWHKLLPVGLVGNFYKPPGFTAIWHGKSNLRAGTSRSLKSH